MGEQKCACSLLGALPTVERTVFCPQPGSHRPASSAMPPDCGLTVVDLSLSAQRVYIGALLRVKDTPTVPTDDLESEKKSEL